MVQADLTHCLTDPNFRPLSRRDLERFGFLPHDVLLNKQTGQAVLLQVKSKQGNDYSLNDPALLGICKAQKLGWCRIAYIGQIDPDDPERLVAWETAYNVRDKVRNCEPRDGRNGSRYYYLSEGTFLPFGRRVAAKPWDDGTFGRPLWRDEAERMPRNRRSGAVYHDLDDDEAPF